jgi:spore germination protein KB
MKTISSRQFSTLTFFVIIIGKLLLLPSILTTYAKQDAYFSVLILCFFEFILFVFLLFFVSRFQKTPVTLLKQKLPTWLHTVVQFCFAGYLFLKTMLIVLEGATLFETSFYGGTTQLEIFLVIVVFLLFVFLFSYQTLMRSLELFKWLFLIGLVFALIVGFYGSNVLFSLPVLQNGVAPVLSGAYYGAFWFFDVVVFLFIFNNVKFTKRNIKQAITHFLIASAIVTLFVALFYNTFHTNSSEQTLAMYHLLQNMSDTSIFSKLDWLFVSFWSLGLLFFMGLYSYATLAVLKQLLKKPNTKMLAFGFAGVLFFMLWLVSFQLEVFYELIQPFASVLSLVPILLVLLFILFHYNRREKCKK